MIRKLSTPGTVGAFVLGSMVVAACSVSAIPAGLDTGDALADASTDALGDHESCCPIGWDLNPCTFPDGGAGQSCHNPQLGCASSLVCGEGCDSVVTGRCEMDAALDVG